MQLQFWTHILEGNNQKRGRPKYTDKHQVKRIRIIFACDETEPTAFFSLNAFMISFVSMLSTSSLCTFMRAKFEHLELVIVLLRQVLRRRNVEKLRSASQLVTGRVRSTRYMRFRLLNILLFANAWNLLVSST